MNLFAKLMEFLPASCAINLPAGQQCAIWNRILLHGPLRWYHLLSWSARPCDFISRGVTGLSRSNRSPGRYTMPARGQRMNTDEGNGFDNRFVAARNLSWTGHYARSTPSASIGGVISIPWQECCSVIVCSGRCWIESGGLSGTWSELIEQRAEILWVCCLRGFLREI